MTTFACDLKPASGIYDLTEDESSSKIDLTEKQSSSKILWLDCHWADLGNPRKLRWLKSRLRAWVRCHTKLQRRNRKFFNPKVANRIADWQLAIDNRQSAVAIDLVVEEELGE